MKRIEHSDDQPVECGNGRLLIGRMRAKIEDKIREDDLYFVTLGNGKNIAWGDARKACKLAKYLDQDDTVITVRFPALSLVGNAASNKRALQDSIAKTAEEYLAGKRHQEGPQDPKWIKDESLDEVLKEYFAQDDLYKHIPKGLSPDVSEAEKSFLPRMASRPPGLEKYPKFRSLVQNGQAPSPEGADVGGNRKPEDQRHAQGEASQNNEHLEEEQRAQSEDQDLSPAEVREMLERSHD